MRRLTWSSLLVTLALIIGCGGDGDETGPRDARAGAGAPWEAVRREARGQTVRWWMYGGDTRINRYIDRTVIPAARRAGVTLERVPVDDTADAVQRVIAQRRAGRERGGAVDLIWINGENFAAGKQAGLWLEDWATDLPSFRFVDPRDPSIARDFQVPVDGQEAPWSRAAFAFAHDTATVPDPPRDLDALLEYARARPGRVTYPAPPDFTGSAFVRQVVAAKGEDGAFAYLRELRPLMHRRGRVLPKDVAELDRLFADGEVDFTMSYETNFVAAQVRRGTFPRTTRPFVLGRGALANVSFVTIPKDASSRAGAQVVADLLLSPALQAEKADPDVLGIATVLDVERLPAAERARFAESQEDPYVLRDLGEPVEEFPAAEVEPLERRWQREVLRGG